MPRKRYPVRKASKARSISDQESETNIDYQTISQPDPQIQHSNSQLPTTLSTAERRRNNKQQNLQEIVQFLMHNKEQDVFVDISGVPGIGKTVAVIEVIQRLKRTVHWKKAIFRYINGMALTMPSKIYYSINRQLYKPQKNDIRGNPAIKLDGKLKEDTRVKIVVIDEIDYLMTKNQAILYTLFDWSNDPHTRLCLIVIANTMNFPQLLQPKITSRMGQNRLVFKPYNHSQVKTIIEQRLMKSNRFSSNAIQYACKKMASYTSDVRKLLEIFKRALEMKKQGVISMQDMVQTWKLCSQQSGNIWQQYLQDHYKDIMTILKDCGGVSDEYKVHQRLQVKRKCTLKQVVLYLIEMEEMGLVRTRTKKKKILLTMEVTLLKI